MSDVIDVTATTLRKLRPPRDGEDPTAWRWFMAIGLVGIGAGLGLHVALACGFLTAIYPGFAKASEASALQREALVVKQEIVTARIEGLEARIFDVRVQQCAAIRDGKSAAAFTYQLQTLLIRYAQVTNKQPVLPSCEELR